MTLDADTPCRLHDLCRERAGDLIAISAVCDGVFRQPSQRPRWRRSGATSAA